MIKNERKKLNCIVIVCVISLIVACSESRKPLPSTIDDVAEESYHREKADSVCEDILQKTKEEVESEKKSQSSSVSKSSGSYSSSSRDNDELEYDNMRGFDPASEDDMPDNGMSRYMENNDEEGWD